MRLDRVRGWQLGIASLVLFLLLAESVLRAAGFQYEPFLDEFEVTEDYEIFERSGETFTTRPRKRGSFAEQTFPAERLPAERRVVVMGGSSVYNLGDLAVLRRRLEAALPPGTSLTLVNAGGRGYGSSRLRLHFQEILTYEPDLVVLYSGHNEFNEKYLEETFYDRGPLARLNELLIRHSRLHQLLGRGIHRASQANIEAVREKRHPLFPPDYERQWEEVYDKDRMHQQYEDNLLAITRTAEGRGVPMVLATVAYNRRAAPFKPSGNDFFACGNLRLAEEFERFRECVDDAIDAGLHPIRATKTTNAIVARVAERRGLPLVDVDGLVVSESRNGIPGFGLFEDHCHLNDRGNELLQNALADAVAEHGLLDR